MRTRVGHIISAATDYDPALLKPFLHSLMRIQFRGKLHLLVSPKNARSMECALVDMGLDAEFYLIRKATSVTQNRAFRLFQYLPLGYDDRLKRHGESRVIRYCLEKAIPVSSYRYIIARGIVAGIDAADTVLLTDSRDVYFQADPFEFYQQHFDGRLTIALETKRIEETNVTYKWMRDVYGHVEAQRHIGKAVSCSGTTMGIRNSMLDYLDRMVYEIIRHRNRISHTCGYDQGMHNYLVYNELLSDATIPENGAGPYQTVQGRLEFDGDGYVRNRRGEKIPLIHQYDRSPEQFAQSEFFASLLNEPVRRSIQQCSVGQGR